MQAFMNPQSLVAVEYIHILNKAFNTPDCMNMPMAPGQGAQGPQGTIQPTRPPSSQWPQWPQGVPGQPGFTPPPHYPTLPHNLLIAENDNLSAWLVAIIVISSISVAAIILVGFYYCIVGSRQK